MALAWLSSKLHVNQAATLHGESKLAATRFDQDELCILQKTWQDLADRNNGRGIDKETFLQYFPVTGLLGERFFAQFDQKGNGLIDFDEFISGLAVSCRGTVDEKIHFLFNMYDVGKAGSVSKMELSTLLNHMPKHLLMEQTPQRFGSHVNDRDKESDSDQSTRADDLEEVDQYTNHDFVEKAFEECDLNHEGRLSYEEFKMWVQRTPGTLEYLEVMLPFVGHKEQHPHSSKVETLPLVSMLRKASNTSHRPASLVRTPSMQFQSSRQSFSGGHPGLVNRERSWSQEGSVQSADSANSPLPHAVEEDMQVILLLQQTMELAQNETTKRHIADILDGITAVEGTGRSERASKMIEERIMKEVVAKQGYLLKRGKSMFHLWNKRFYLLSGNCMYYYWDQKEIRPRGVIFLTGCIVDRVHDRDLELKGYWGLELLHQDLCTGEHHRHDKRVLYCRTEEERDEWVTMLQHAAHVIPIEEDYVIGRELGRGRFSIVHECVNKQSGQHFAVKVIDKATIEPEEKALLRTEIAVLKLVDHPNIIKMEGLYESKTHLYIVMEILKGGELFERIVGRPRFTEQEAAKLIRPVLESVAYIHDLGIVHRDLKPENILCGENLEDIKIADFGLSKMVLPREKMDAACGTLSYVAPEVLTMQGYGKEADLWSVGVIMFLVLCGKLPFDGEDHSEIIRSTMQAELRPNPNVWSKLSEEARTLITALLNKNPKERITARNALRHPFILNNCPRKLSMSSTKSSDNLLMTALASPQVGSNHL